jgi:hypothetical protein
MVVVVVFIIIKLLSQHVKIRNLMELLLLLLLLLLVLLLLNILQIKAGDGILFSVIVCETWRQNKLFGRAQEGAVPS